MLKQYAQRVKFRELYEVKGAFGQESVSPGGAIFPKHLICSYDIRTKSVVFPFGWMLTEFGGTNEDGFRRTHRKFRFYQYWHSIIQHRLVIKIDPVEIEYDPKDFEPDLELVKMTLVIRRKKKYHVDKLIQQYLAAKTIVAERSMASTKVTLTSFTGKKKKKGKTLLKHIKRNTLLKHTYELILLKSEWKVFVEQLYKQKLIPAKERYAILLEENVFPKQLAYFNK